MIAIEQVDERVSRLEEVFAHFMEQTELMLASTREDAEEFRMSIARTDRKLLEMQQQAEKNHQEADRKWAQMQQQADKDRQQAEMAHQEADRKWAQMQEQADKDRQQTEMDQQEANRKWAQMQQQADKDRQQTEMDQQEANRKWAQMQEQADKDRQQAEMAHQEANRRWAQMQEQADKEHQQAEMAHQEADRRWAQMQEQAEMDRQESNRKWTEMQQKADKERQQADKERQQADKERKDFNRRLAQITDSQGLMIENMVWPNLNRIACELFDGETPLTSGIRIKRRRTDVLGENMEIDLLAAGTTKVLVCEAKSKVDASKAADFLKKLKAFPDYFPEYAGHRLLPMIASIAFEESVLRHLTSQGIYALGFGDETMELLNARLIDGQ